jgi:apolipoprotein D and lipocalin family protein
MPARTSLALALALGLASPALAQNTQSRQGDVPGMNPGMMAVQNFTPDTVAGQWYEIARLDHPFERGLTRVTSTRTKTGEGAFEIVNRGFDKATNGWREAKATARILPDKERPTLEIDYGTRKHTYEVLDLAPDGSFSLVGSTDKDALWVFSRTPTLDPSVVDRMKARAISFGFNLDRLEMVSQQGG